MEWMVEPKDNGGGVTVDSCWTINCSFWCTIDLSQCDDLGFCLIYLN